MDDDYFNVDEYLPGGKKGPKHHMKTKCKIPELPCPTFNSCDIDLNLCKSNDIIAITSRIIVNGFNITGKPESLLNYLLSIGYTLKEIVESKVNVSNEIRRLAVQAYKGKSETYSVPIFPTKLFVYQGVKFDLLKWPQKFLQTSLLFLNFFSPMQQYRIMDTLNNEYQRVIRDVPKNPIKQKGDISIVTEQLNTTNPSIISGVLVSDRVPIFKCLGQLIQDQGLIGGGLFLEEIIISRRTLNEKLPDHRNIVIFSFGNSGLLESTFFNQRISVPLLAGSMLSFYNDQEGIITQLPEYDSKVTIHSNNPHLKNRVSLLYIFRPIEKKVRVKSVEELKKEIKGV